MSFDISNQSTLSGRILLINSTNRYWWPNCHSLCSLLTVVNNKWAQCTKNNHINYLSPLGIRKIAPLLAEQKQQKKMLVTAITKFSHFLFLMHPEGTSVSYVFFEEIISFWHTLYYGGHYWQWSLIWLSKHLHRHYSQCYFVHRRLNNMWYNKFIP